MPEPSCVVAHPPAVYRLPMNPLSGRDVHRALAVVAAAAAGGNGTAFGIETVDAIVAAIPAGEGAYGGGGFGEPRPLPARGGGGGAPGAVSAPAPPPASRAVETNRSGSTRRSRRPAARTRCATS